MTYAKKRFGQHFLEPAWVTKTITAIKPQATDVFLEIGPGQGALTKPLSGTAAHVVAFEIDRDLAHALSSAGEPRLTVVEGDFLEVTTESIRTALQFHAGRPIRVVGNLPYNVAGPILFKLVALYRDGIPIQDMTLMVQREVADRLIAKPSTHEYGVLTILIGRHAAVAPRLQLPPGAFRPQPKVRSTLLGLTFHPVAPPAAREDIFEAVTRAIFTRRRKTLTNALLAFPPSSQLPPIDALQQAGLDGRRRPETLSIAELVRLADVFAAASANTPGRAML